jgi:hypothetical protein
MSIAAKLEKLARYLPGVAGYQDQESSRDTDKLVRTRLAEDLTRISRGLDENKRVLAGRHHFAPLPELERLGSKISALANTITYASRGYRAFLDLHKITQEKLDRLYAFDLELFHDVETIAAEAVMVRESLESPVRLRESMENLSVTIDALDSHFSKRQYILTES